MMETVRSWISDHKLTSIGALWAAAIGTSLAYNSRSARTRSTPPPLKPSLRLIHARMHAQALTVAVLSGVAAYHYYYEKRSAQELDATMAPN